MSGTKKDTMTVSFEKGNRSYDLSLTAEDINPKLAAKYLERRKPEKKNRQGLIEKSNRKPSEKWVESLAEAMKIGEFVFTGDCIRFDLNNHLIDGQHRLLAIIQSGQTFRTLVMRGLPVTAINGCDRGRRRTIAQDLNMHGHRYSQDLSSVLCLLYTEKVRKGKINHRVQPRSIVAQKLLRRTPGLINSVEFCAKIKGGFKDTRIKLSTAAWAHYRMSLVSPEIADNFWSNVSSGVCNRKDDPALKLRNKLIRSALEKYKASGLQLTTQAKDALLIKACVAAIHQQKIKVLRYVSNQDYPIFPWDSSGNFNKV